MSYRIEIKVSPIDDVVPIEVAREAAAAVGKSLSSMLGGHVCVSVHWSEDPEPTKSAPVADGFPYG